MSELREISRWLHLGSGFAAVALGLVVMFLPKFGPRSAWHRWAGRVYTSLIALACLLGVPLAYRQGNNYLVMLGTITFLLIVRGWLDARVARQAAAHGDRETATRYLRWHLILMGASYIGAWSGFFATIPLFGTGDWLLLMYVFGPSVIGAVFIARTVTNLNAKLGSNGSPVRSKGLVTNAREPIHDTR